MAKTLLMIAVAIKQPESIHQRCGCATRMITQFDVSKNMV